MRVRLIQLIDNVRTSYWFLPSLMALGSVLLFLAMSWADRQGDPSWIEKLSWLALSRPSGARAVLSTIAGSMIGVAGVTFSITIAAVSFASVNFGPRLLTNFMRDRGNQVTLGTFIATYLYCLLVLRTVRDSAPEGLGDDAAAAFVPQASLLAALMLALCSVGVLIYFLHHVPDSIRISTLVAEIGTHLIDRVGDHFPAQLGEGEEGGEPGQTISPLSSADTVELRSPANGYLQHISPESLMKCAIDHDVIVWLDCRPGDFLHRGQPIGVFASARSSSLTAEESEQIAQALVGAFALGRGRTQAQDFHFLIDELVEIASRATSPGVNDPFTAMMCLDWLGSALVEMGSRKPLDPLRRDPDGELRLVVAPIDFKEVAARIFEQLRPYISSDLNTALHALRVMATAGAASQPEARAALLRHAQDLVETVTSGPCTETDRSRIADELAQLRASLGDGEAPLGRRVEKRQQERTIKARE